MALRKWQRVAQAAKAKEERGKTRPRASPCLHTEDSFLSNLNTQCSSPKHEQLNFTTQPTVDGGE